MKKLRILFIIFICIWMIIIFRFSNQQGEKSENTSTGVTKIIAKIIYKDDENLVDRIEKLDPIIRKTAHYTIYLIGGVLIRRSIIYIRNRY